jgi:TonB family protein
VSALSFDVLAAYALQSTVVAVLALGLERLLPAADVASRRALWTLALVAGLLGPLGYAFILRGAPAAVSDSVVFAIETVSRSAPAGARIGAVWIAVAGAALLGIWRICGLVRLRRYVAEADSLSGEELRGEIANLEVRTGATADYRVSAAVEGPLMCGWRNPVILLPAGFTDMPSAERMGVLAHELTHVRRQDWLKLLAEEALRCIVWFTPAVHIILRRGRVAREMQTDALAVEATRDRGSYLNALVEIARRPIRADALVAPLFLEPRSLKARVATLLEDRPMSNTRRFLAFAAIFLLLPLAGRWARDAFPSRLQAAQGTVHKVGEDGVKAPKLLTKVEPQYTDEASEAKLEGTVILKLEVHPDGRAYNIRVERGLGMGLDEQAISAVEQWTFEPALKDGEPVTVAATVEMNFKLM